MRRPPNPKGFAARTQDDSIERTSLKHMYQQHKAHAVKLRKEGILRRSHVCSSPKSFSSGRLGSRG